MKIDQHWLSPVRREPIAGGSLMTIRRVLVMHFTSGATALSSVNFWRSPAAKGACAHVIIDRDGSVIQCRPFNVTCGHAGVSRWRDPHTGRLFEGVNSCGIGIELANAGDDPQLAARYTKLPLVSARHRNGGRVCTWEAYPPAQIDAALAVAGLLVAQYKLDDVTGHDCIAPERKNDPGPAFPMLQFREALGFHGLPAVHFAGR